MIGRRPGPPRDADHAARSQALAILSLGGLACLVMGGAVGHLLEWGVVLGVLVIGVPLAGLMWAMAHVIVERGGKAAAVLFTPSDGPPERRALSLEESLIARGQIEEAVESLMAAAALDPGDPRPARRLAELYRDELGAPLEAVEWLRRAAAVPELTPEEERHLLRELVELCERRLGVPKLAAPALARTASVRAGTRVGIWARQELARIRAGSRGGAGS